MQITCPQCHKKYQVDDSKLALANKNTIKCKDCGAHMFGKSEYQDETVVISAPPAGREPEKEWPPPDTPESSDSSDPDDTPKKIGGYQVEGMLGKGAMGTVYKCLDVALHRHVAVKVLLLEEEDHRKRFFKEARALAQLSHPNITQIYTAGEEEGYPYFVMEFVDGPSIKEQLVDENRFSISKALDIAIQVCNGLKEAHQSSIIHRDIKTANILINADGLVKITDFGLAKLLTDDQHLTQTKMVMGTPYFISPEQGRGEKVDFRSDIYSLGVMLYQMIIGHLPFNADDAMTLIMMHIKEPVTFPTPSAEFSIPPAIAGIIRKMMAKNPDDRFLNYDQLIDNLSRLKKSFQALQAGETQMAAPGQFHATSTTIPNARMDATIMKTMVMAPEKHTSSTFKFPTRLFMPVALLILLGFFGLLFKSGVKKGSDSLNKGPSASESMTAPASASLVQVSPELSDERSEPFEVEIIKNEIEQLTNSDYRVFGTIRNTGTSAARDLVVEVSFENAFGDIIEEHQIEMVPSTILPGETGRFSLVFKDIKFWDRYFLWVGDLEVETERD